MENNNQISPEMMQNIDRFLLKEMNAEEEQSFRSLLEQDQALREKTDDMQLIVTAIGENAMKEKLNEFHRDLIPSRQLWTAYTRWVVSVAAILVVAFTLWRLFSGTANDKLFDHYFRPDPGLVSTMGISDSYQFDRAMVDYKSENFQAAIDAWKTMHRDNSASDTLHYFIGAAYLAEKKSDSSITYLRAVATNPRSEFYSEANWYMGLAFLLQNNRAQAIKHIQRSAHKEKDTLLSKLKK